MDESFVGYRLEEDLPATLLTLRWNGPAPRRWIRWMPLVALLIVAGIGGTMFWQVWGATIQRAVAQGAIDPGDLVPMLFVLVISLAMGGNVLALWVQQCRALGFWRELTWDARDGLFRGRFVGAPLIGRRGMTIPLAELSHIGMEVGAEGESTVPLELTMTFKGKRPAVVVALDVQDVDRRVEALDLLFRLARVVGFASFVIFRNTPQQLDVTVLPAPSEKWLEAHRRGLSDDDRDEDEELEDDLDDEDYPVNPAFDVVPIPDDRSLADYEKKFSASVGFEEPTVFIPKFLPKKLAEDVGNTQLATWEPGELVKFHRQGWPIEARILFALVAGVAVGLIFAFPLEFFVRLALLPHHPNRWLIFAGATVVGGLSLFWYMWPLMTEREAVFDWQRAVVQFRNGAKRKERSLSEIQALTLGGIRSSRTRWDGRRMTYTTNPRRGQLRMTLADSDEVVIETDLPGDDWEQSTQKLLPLTVALARALNVPWNMVDARGGRRPPGWMAPTRGQSILLTVGVLLVTALIGWHSWVKFDTDRRFQLAREELDRRGAHVELVASRGFRQTYELTNAWRVEFPSGVDDALLASLVEHLAHLPRLDLNLSGTRVTDQSVSQLSTLKNLAALDLSNTAVTDAGLEPLFRLNNVEILNLAGTAAGDHAVSTSAMINRLRVLLIDRTRVTDDGFQNLRICSNLRYVSVTSTKVTPSGADGLRQALPGVIIEGLANATH